MPRDASANGALGQAVREVSQHAVNIAKLEARLARAEVARKARLALPTVVLGALALVLALFALGFGLAAAASGLGEAIPGWAALLVVCGALGLAATVLGLLAAASAKRASPPVPEQAIAEAKETQRALKEAGG